MKQGFLQGECANYESPEAMRCRLQDLWCLLDTFKLASTCNETRKEMLKQVLDLLQDQSLLMVLEGDVDLAAELVKEIMSCVMVDPHEHHYTAQEDCGKVSLISMLDRYV